MVNSTLTLLQTSYNTFRLQARYIALARFNRINEGSQSQRSYMEQRTTFHITPRHRETVTDDSRGV